MLPQCILTLPMTFIFPTASQHLSCLSMCQFISYFSPHSQPSSLPISLPLQFRPLSHLSTILSSLFPPSLHLTSSPPSLLSPSFPPSSASATRPTSLSLSCQQSSLSAVAVSSISPIHLSLQPLGGEREEKPQAAFLKKPVAATGINMRSLGRCRFSLKLTFKLFRKYEIKPRAQMGLHPLLF